MINSTTVFSNIKGKEQPETWIHSKPGAMRKTVGLSYEAEPQ